MIIEICFVLFIKGVNLISYEFIQERQRSKNRFEFEKT